MPFCSIRNLPKRILRKLSPGVLLGIPLYFWIFSDNQRVPKVTTFGRISNNPPDVASFKDLALQNFPRKGCPMYLNATHILKESSVHRIRGEVVLLPCKQPLNTSDVQSRKLGFVSSFYPLELNFEEMIRVQLEGKKMINEPINPHDFTYIHTGENVCDKSSIYLIIVVKSAVGNFEDRRVIRKTWGDVGNYEGVRLVFLLGYDVTVERRVREEASKHNDIIQEDFIDHYSNNTLKTIMGINWVAKYCPNAQFSFYIDDDVFLIVDNLKKIRKSALQKSGVMIGKVLCSSVPYRDNTSKWFVSWETYPFDNYPKYLAGFAYLMTTDVVKKFSMAIPYIKPIPIDDTYLGIVAEKLRITPRTQTGFVMSKPSPFSKGFPRLNFRNTIAFHRITSPTMMLQIWTEYCTHSKFCKHR